MDIRGCSLGVLTDLTFGTFLDLGLSGETKKKLEWIDKVLAKGQPDHISAAQIGPAVNEQEIAKER